MFSNELARRYGDKGIVSTAVHPGSIRTDLQRHLKGLVVKILVSTSHSIDYIPSAYAEHH